jgi:glycosyltransferase involved in cell wall biosynthesis
MESNRRWRTDWGALKVIVQRTLSVPSRGRDGNGFHEDKEIHIPYDTLPQLAGFRPDAIVAAEFGMRTMQAALYKCFAPRTRLIVWATISEITERYRGPLRRLIRQAILTVTDGVLVNGRSGARYLESLGYAPEKIHLVPQATDNSLFAGPATRPADPVRKLLYAGQLIERKGLVYLHEQLIRWCGLHPDRKIVWTLVGTGPLRETILGWERPENYGLELLEEVPFRDLAELYRRADLFALPTLADEWGLVVNEAMIAGLPVLGSVYSQAVEDLVTDGLDGWTFRPDHPEEVFGALDRALSCNAEELDTMRAHAIATVKPLDAEDMKSRIVGALTAGTEGSR